MDDRINRSAQFLRSLPQSEDGWSEAFPSPGELFGQIGRINSTTEIRAVLSEAKSGSLPTGISQPWLAFLATLEVVLDRLMQAPPHDPPLKYVQLTGSVAKGTAASPHISDLDIVCVFEGKENEHYSEDAEQHKLDWVERCMEPGLKEEISIRSFYFRLPALDTPSLAPKSTLHQSTYEQAYCGDLPGHRGSIPSSISNKDPSSIVEAKGKYIHVKKVGEQGPSVDLLMGGDLATDDVNQVFRKDNRPNWPRLAPCVSYMCVNFVRSQNKYVLIAIRALKSWRDVVCDETVERKNTPSSFLIELLCIWASREETVQPTAPAIFWKAMEMLAAPVEELCITWPDNVRSYDIGTVETDMINERPLVLDPWKHWNNVARASNFKIVGRVARKAVAQRHTDSVAEAITSIPDLIALMEDAHF